MRRSSLARLVGGLAALALVGDVSQLTAARLPAQQQLPVFESLPQRPDASSGATTIRVHADRLVAATQARTTFSLPLPGGESLQLVPDRIEAQSQGHFVVAALAAGEGEATFTTYGGSTVGRIVAGDRLLVLEPVRGTDLHEIRQIDSATFPPEADPLTIDDEPSPPTRDAVLPETAATVDVLIVYTPQARALVADITALAAASVNSSNLALANAGVSDRFRLVHTAEVNYTEDTASTDLGRLRSATDGHMDAVHDLRNQHGADVVTLLRTPSSEVCGIGYLMSSPTQDFQGSAFNVVTTNCANANLTLAHEIGHNVGLHHDRKNATSSPAFDYAYGYRISGSRDVMAYDCSLPAGGAENFSCPKRTIFSTPLFNFPGTSSPAGTPTEDNARALRGTMPAAATFRETVVSSCASSSENDDSFGTARALTPGLEAMECVSAANDRDYYRFTLDTAQHVRLRLTVPSGADYRFDVFSGNQSFIDQASDSGEGASESLDRTLEAGTYYVRILGTLGSFSTTGAYGLLLTAPVGNDPLEPNNIPGAAVELASGAPAAAFIYTKNDVDYYRLTLAREQHLRIQLAVPGNADLRVQLFSPQLSFLAEADADGQGAPELLWRTLSAGTYYIKVEGRSGSYSQTSQYQLTATAGAFGDAFEPNGTSGTGAVLTSGSEVTAHVFTSNDDDFYRIDLAQASHLELKLTVPSNADLQIDLYSSTLSFLAAADASGQGVNELLWRTLPAGSYYLLVRGRSGSFSQTQPYRLTATAGHFTDTHEPNDVSNTAAALTSGVGVQSRIFTPNDIDYFVITVAGDSHLVLNLSTPVDADVDLHLYTSSLSFLAASENQGHGVAELLRRTVAAGTYYIRVSGRSGGHSRTQSYSLTATYGQFTDSYEPNNSRSSSYAVSARSYQALAYTANDSDWYRFDMASGGTFTATLTGVFATSLELELYGSNGSFLAVAPSTGPVTISRSLSAGTYYLLVDPRGAGQSTTEPYGLTLSGPLVEPTQPSITLQPSDRTIRAGQSTTFSVTASGVPAPSIRWQSRPPGGGWVDLAEDAPYSGTQTPTLSVTAAPANLDRREYRAVATNGPGTATSLGAMLTVYGDIAPRPNALSFAAIKEGAAGALTSVTPPQVVSIVFEGRSGDWSASVDQPWVQLSNTSSVGNGTMAVSIGNPSNVLGGSTAVAATLTIVSTTAPNSPYKIGISLTVRHTAANAPFGQVDTPSQNTSGLVGAIGVTGWAMDDVGVAGVKIYRNCLPFENQASCQTVGGHAVVFVGDAAFLSGARPDVEAAFPTHPQAYRAGWGYLMLTSMLPHVTGQRSHGGQGPLTLYAFATDVEGNVRLLGRSQTDQTATSITMANDTIAKPFGAIDTPGQGETVSGIVHNFGWALTPDTDTVAGNGDILIPTNGATMTVFIDGQPVANVAYNQCRGTVGNPVPSGLYCNDDVSNIFGAATPQAPLTQRTSNPTKFRNLDTGRAAIGVYSLDTRALSNGMHTIAWSVTDSAGRNEGIGSRFFNVLNSSSDTAAAAQELQQRTPVVHGRAELLVGGGGDRSPADSSLSLRTGFDLEAAFTDVSPDPDGVYRVASKELDRLEIRVPFADRAYLEVNGELRDLPAGSSLRDGAFAWIPPAGFVGEYRIVVAGGGRRAVVAIAIGGY